MQRWDGPRYEVDSEAVAEAAVDPVVVEEAAAATEDEAVLVVAVALVAVVATVIIIPTITVSTSTGPATVLSLREQGPRFKLVYSCSP